VKCVVHYCLHTQYKIVLDSIGPQYFTSNSTQYLIVLDSIPFPIPLFTHLPTLLPPLDPPAQGWPKNIEILILPVRVIAILSCFGLFWASLAVRVLTSLCIFPRPCPRPPSPPTTLPTCTKNCIKNLPITHMKDHKRIHKKPNLF
jgi:hypothetical protein